MTDKILAQVDSSMEPTPLEDLTKEQLVELYFRTITTEEEIKSQKSILREAIVSKMRGNAEIVGDYQVNRKMRKGDFEVTIEEAEQYGATQTIIKVDTKKLNELEKEGVELKRKPSIEWLEVKAK